MQQPFHCDVGVAPELAPESAARVMLETFARRGVRAAFGIPGGLISPIFDALADVPEIELVSTRHEAMAAYAAMGHAVATGVPALVLTTSGPGITNAITGIAAAFVEEIPLIALGGEVSHGAVSRGAFQDSSTNGIDAVSMLRTVTRWCARIEDRAGAAGAAEQAMTMATGARPGPVFLSVPVDVAGGRSSRTRLSISVPPPSLPDPLACAELARRLRLARRPLIVAGNGARGAAAELRAFAERVDSPVVTTPHAKGVFPDSHRLSLGGIGFGGHPSATEYLEARPDVVCVIGSRLGDFATNGWSLDLCGSAATFQIDREPFLIGRNYPVTMGIVADAKAALSSALAALPTDVARPARRSNGGIRRYRPDLAVSTEVPLKPARVIRALQTAFPDAFWTGDIGEHCAYALHYLEIDDPSSFRTMVGLGSMGTGIGLAIGARHARRDRPVIGICGDGGFAMHAGDVLTCVEHGIDVMLVVLNDGRWNMVHHGFHSVFGRLPSAMPRHVADLAGVAREFGAVGCCVRTPEDLDPDRLRGLLHARRPVVLDARIDPDHPLSVRSRTRSLKGLRSDGARS